MPKKTPSSKSKAKGPASKAASVDKKKVLPSKVGKAAPTKPVSAKKPEVRGTTAKGASAKTPTKATALTKATMPTKQPTTGKGKSPELVKGKSGTSKAAEVKAAGNKSATGNKAKGVAKGSEESKATHEAQKHLLDKHRKDKGDDDALVVVPRPKLQFYTIADVKEYLATRKKAGSKLNLWVPEEERKAREKAAAAARSQGTRTHNVAAASIDDLLGGNFSKTGGDPIEESKQIPEKFRRYYRLLVDMREALQKGVAFHSEEALKKNGKDDAGDLSGYSQHLADAGTDTADRDFALSLISNEQEALKDIADAIESMKRGTYGICEITQKPIPHARLMAVPFTRYSLDGQKELERNRRAHRRRGAGNPLGEISDEVGFGTGGGGGEDEPSDS
jgi:RNA polymerase-binding transcription factor DksA